MNREIEHFSCIDNDDVIMHLAIYSFKNKNKLEIFVDIYEDIQLKTGAISNRQFIILKIKQFFTEMSLHVLLYISIRMLETLFNELNWSFRINLNHLKGERDGNAQQLNTNNIYLPTTIV